MIKYLLKFVTKINYAELLLNGELYMRPACYYHALEMGQGDIAEAGISHDLCIYKHSRVPIFCTYAVEEEEITGDSFTVSERCIKDFKCENGYVVIIDFQKFESALPTLISDGYEVDAGLVTYHKLTYEDTGKLIADDTPKNLFIKHPFFSYQKEFRIVVCRELYKQNDCPINQHTYKFPHDLRNMATCKKVSDAKEGSQYIFRLS